MFHLKQNGRRTKTGGSDRTSTIFRARLPPAIEWETAKTNEPTNTNNTGCLNWWVHPGWGADEGTWVMKNSGRTLAELKHCRNTAGTPDPGTETLLQQHTPLS